MNTENGADALLRAQAALEIGRPKQALDSLRQALATNPHDPDVLVLLARTYATLEQPGEQLSAARSALRQRPDDYEALFLAGAAALQLTRRDDAIDYLRRAIALEPEIWIAHSYLGLALAETRAGRSEAMASVERGVELGRDDAMAHSLAGHVAVAARDFSHAETYFRAALELEPDDADAMNGLSMVLGSTGRRREAAEGFGATLALDPQHDLARHNLDWLITKTLQRVHLTLFVGLFIVVRTVRAAEWGRHLAVVVAVITCAVVVVSIVTNHRQLPESVTRYTLAFPRRQPIRAAWGVCSAVAFAGLVACIVAPPDIAFPYAVVGYFTLFLGCLLSWIARAGDE